MFENKTVCLLTMTLGTVAYLAGLFFILQAAKDAGIMWVLAIFLLCACGSIFGKAAKTLFSEGFFSKIIAGMCIGIFALGTLLVVYFVFVII